MYAGRRCDFYSKNFATIRAATDGTAHASRGAAAEETRDRPRIDVISEETSSTDERVFRYRVGVPARHRYD